MRISIEEIINPINEKQITGIDTNDLYKAPTVDFIRVLEGDYKEIVPIGDSEFWVFCKHCSDLRKGISDNKLITNNDLKFLLRKLNDWSGYEFFLLKNKVLVIPGAITSFGQCGKLEIKSELDYSSPKIVDAGVGCSILSVVDLSSTGKNKILVINLGTGDIGELSFHSSNPTQITSARHIFPTKTCLGHKALEIENGRIFLGCNSGVVAEWNFRTKDYKILNQRHYGAVTDILKLKDGRILTGSQDGLIKIWDSVKLDCIQTLFGHKAPIIHINILSTGLLFTASSDGIIKIWELNKYICERTFINPKPIHYIHALEKSPPNTIQWLGIKQSQGDIELFSTSFEVEPIDYESFEPVLDRLLDNARTNGIYLDYLKIRGFSLPGRGFLKLIALLREKNFAVNELVLDCNLTEAQEMSLKDAQTLFLKNTVSSNKEYIDGLSSGFKKYSEIILEIELIKHNLAEFNSKLTELSNSGQISKTEFEFSYKQLLDHFTNLKANFDAMNRQHNATTLLLSELVQYFAPTGYATPEFGQKIVEELANLKNEIKQLKARQYLDSKSSVNNMDECQNLYKAWINYKNGADPVMKMLDDEHSKQNSGSYQAITDVLKKSHANGKDIDIIESVRLSQCETFLKAAASKSENCVKDYCNNVSNENTCKIGYSMWQQQSKDIIRTCLNEANPQEHSVQNWGDFFNDLSHKLSNTLSETYHEFCSYATLGLGK